MKSVNPANGELIKEYAPYSEAKVDELIKKTHARFASWKVLSFGDRAKLMHKAADMLAKRKEEFAGLMADEMGKVFKEACDEIDKCALCCRYYADNAQVMLADELIKTDARKSMVSFQPLGVILAIMPWNFPFWQVFRFAAPHLMAGNVGVLKHASNVPGCALAIESVFTEAGFPENVFSTLLVGSDAIDDIIANPLIAAVTLTGSVEAGKKVAAKAGGELKKTVLELGGSDPYIVLADVMDVKKAAEECAKSRLLNAGQSCIAAKRFIVESPILQEFETYFLAYFKKIIFGHPRRDTSHIGPLAREDLRDQLHEQVEKSLEQGAHLLHGGVVPEGPGAFYPPTILTHVKPGMVAFDEELFGPVAAIIEAKDSDEAFHLANATDFGLGSALFTSSPKAEEWAKTRMDAGQAFVNTFVRSDIHLPFGGIKHSGYGRELSALGIREFVNAKTVYIA